MIYTLIKAVREARRNGHKWLAIDRNGKIYSYPDKPKIKNPKWFSRFHKYIGAYKLTCDWKDTLIDCDKILVR